jgi:hypothetical protein
MTQLLTDYHLTYNIIPFAEFISRRPIRTFVNRIISNQTYTIDIDTTKVTESVMKYSFTKEELSMPVINSHKFIKDNNFSNKQILAYKIARRRYNNCIYSKRARETRKNKQKLQTNTLNISSIGESVKHEIIKDLPELIHYTYIHI